MVFTAGVPEGLKTWWEQCPKFLRFRKSSRSNGKLKGEKSKFCQKQRGQVPLSLYVPASLFGSRRSIIIIIIMLYRS